jgi:hypothetical protein
LSTLEPFNIIPEGIWIDAISSISQKEKIKNANISAYYRGRKIKYEE